MSFNDITQCVHLAISTNFGIASVVISEDKCTTFMGGQIAPIHPQVLDSLGSVPEKVCEQIQSRVDELGLTADQLRTKTAIVRWGKVRYIDETNQRISCIIGVDLIKGGAL